MPAQEKKKAAASGRKTRSSSFQRYWYERRDLRGLRRHVKAAPNDAVAKAALERKEIEPARHKRVGVYTLPGGKQ